MVGSSGNCSRKVWGCLTGEFFTSRTYTDIRNVGEVVVVPWPLWSQLTRRIVSLLQLHQQGLVPRPAEVNFLRNNVLGLSDAVLAHDDCAKPINRFPEGLDDQLTGLAIGRNGILKCWGLGLDTSRPDIEPFGKMHDKSIELRVSLECSFKRLKI